MQRFNRDHFYSSIGNSLFERSYNKNADRPLASIALEITVVIVIMQTRLIAIQRKFLIVGDALHSLDKVYAQNVSVYSKIQLSALTQEETQGKKQRREQFCSQSISSSTFPNTPKHLASTKGMFEMPTHHPRN